MKKTYKVSGMHCASCELIITQAIEELPTVKVTNISAKKNHLELQFTDPQKINILEEKIANRIKKLGYIWGDIPRRTLFSQDPTQWTIVILSLLVLGLISLIAKDQGWSISDLTNNTGKGDMLFFPLLMGLVAGISSCMALVGGLVLAITAKRNEQHQGLTSWQRFTPQLIFQAGRIGGFIVFGGILGLLGQIIIFDGQNIAIGLIIAGIVMLILGIDLTKLIPGIKAISIKLPFSISKKGSNRSAFIGGILSFFLPCGFTLSMWVLAMATGGSFWGGAFILGSFALGTMPGLLGIGALMSWIKGNLAKYLFPIVGVIVAIFGISTISQGRHLFGYDGLLEANATRPTETQTILYTEKGIFPNEIHLKQGNNYIIRIQPQVTLQGCMSTLLLPGLDSHISMVRKNEDIILQFTAKKKGSYEFVCAMGLSHNAKIIIE